jgi:hypothetical protein
MTGNSDHEMFKIKIEVETCKDAREKPGTGGKLTGKIC